MAHTGVLFLICCFIALSFLFLGDCASTPAPWQFHPSDDDDGLYPVNKPDALKMDTQLASIVAMAKSSFISLQEFQTDIAMSDATPYTELSTFDTAAVNCSSTVENTRDAICDIVLPGVLLKFQPSDVAENPFIQGSIASAIPDMGAQVKLVFPSANLTLLLSRSTLRGLHETTYSLEHGEMHAEVSFPDTFKPIRLNTFLKAVTSGDIRSIYSLPSMEDDDTFVVALAISYGNSSAPMHLSPIEAIPQVSSIALHVNSTGDLEPVIAQNLKFPPKPFISVTLTTAEITDKNIADRIDHAYGSPKCSRLDMEKGAYTRTGMTGDDSFTEKSSNPTRYTIQCKSDRLEISDHTKITILYQEPISWATLIYASSVVGIGLIILVIMIATDANAICAGRPKTFQPIDLSRRGTLFSELMKNHLWLGLLTGIGDNFKSSTIKDPSTGQKVMLPPEWSVRKYQALTIWTSSLISYSVGAMALVSSLRSPTYFPLDENPTKYLLQDYWLACVMCAIACGKGVHIILDLVFSRFQYTFATIQVNPDSDKKKKKKNFSIADTLESIILGRYFPLPLNLIPITFCVLFIAGMCFVTIYLGLDYDWQATYLWTIGAVAAVLIDIIVLDPAYIGMRAFVLSFLQTTKTRDQEQSQKHDLVEEEETIANTRQADDDTMPVKGEEQSHQTVGDSIKRISTTDSKPTAQSDLSSEKKPEKSHVRDSWLVWALTLFTWEYMTPMIFKGITRPLEIPDLQPTSIYDHSSTLTTRFMLVWEPMSQKIKNGAVLIRAMVAVFGSHFFLATLLRFAADALTVVSPLIMMELIKCLVDLSRDPLPGYLLIVAMFLGNFLSASFQNQAFDVSTRLGMNVRSTLASSVYRKSLVLSNKARQTRSTGQIVNLMSIDAEKFQMVMPFLPWVVTSFLQIAVSLGFLFYYLKYAAFLSVGIMLALIPLNVVLMGFFQTMRKRVLLNTDKRVKAVNEMLQSIRIVKFFAWEDSFTTEIGRIRRYELIQFIGLAVCKAILGVVLNGAPIIISVGTFGLYAAVYGQEKLTPDLVFPSMAYLNILRFPMTFMPMLLAMTIDLSVSLGRVGSFLQEEELQKDAIATVVDNADDLENSIVIDNGCFEWEVLPDEEDDKKQKKKKRGAKKLSKEMNRQQPQQDKLQQQIEIELQEEVASSSAENEPVVSHDVGKLIDIDLKVRKGSLTVIVGTVGSGKSSLLCSLIGDMKRTEGSVTLAGSIAYCTQSAWIINDTVRGNITFGKPFDQGKYDEIVKVCALETDLEILTGGDQTEIGEKGVNLSGGQRQRISLARAVYSDADIYLLDDPLSAVDAHVGKHLFDKCITERLQSKTRVLVTHQIQHIHKADYVVVMDQGRIVEQGTFNELINYGPGGFLVEMMKELREHEQEEEEETIVELGMDESKHTSDAVIESEVQIDDETVGKLQAEANEAQSALMTLEERTTGRLSFKNVMFYVMASGGPIIASIVMILYGIAQAGILMTDWWLTQWTSNKYTHLNLEQYFGIYIGIGAVSMVLVFFRDTIFSFLGVLGSKRLHERMLKRVIRAPSSFFDTTPIGRILNRFSKDMESVDQILGTMLTQFFSTMLQTIGNCVLMIIAMYWLSIPLAIFSVIYLIIQQIYTSTFRELKRIDAISRSPVYSHFSESLTGLSSIRAYGRQQDFIDKFDERLDINVGAFRMQNDVQRWLSFRLDVLGSLCTLAVGIMAMIMRDSDTVDPSMMSLALTYSLSMTMMLSFMVRNATEAEAAFASVERIAYYVANVPVEAPAIISDNRPPQEWPDKGEIVFENVDARYRPELPLVIKDVSMSIKSNEKIGVVGRTGSGKSTIMLLLFRMFDVADGRIVIDGININDIGLDDLRNKIAIIPQEATLFTGTVRSNLDPFNNYTDKFLWEALERAHLKETIEKLEKGLDAPVSENGENFSVGQRQLICLARALCKQSKILILDEASASLDFATDALIQKTVREAFADCTRLTIAHRLNTIIDSDRVLVLDQGRIMEFDSPRNLFLNHPEGIFSSLVNETGQANAALLRSIALGEITFDSALEEMQKLQEQEQMKEQQEQEQDKGGELKEKEDEIPQEEVKVEEEEQEQSEEAIEEEQEQNEEAAKEEQEQNEEAAKEEQEQNEEAAKEEQEQNEEAAKEELKVESDSQQMQDAEVKEQQEAEQEDSKDSDSTSHDDPDTL